MKRFSIRFLLIVVATCGFYFAALAAATERWIAVCQSVRFFALALAIAGSLLVRGPERAFWIGFAIFGWLYVLFQTQVFLNFFKPVTPAGNLPNEIAVAVHSVHTSQIVPKGMDMSLITWDEGRQLYVWDPGRKVERAEKVAICMMGMFYSLAGGFVARLLASRASTRSQGNSSEALAVKE
jgi:hypothetical protein